jgi:hypothetical protein
MEKVYVTPGVRDDAVHVPVPAVAFIEAVHVADGLTVTEYAVMVAPPSLSGTFHDTTADVAVSSSA